MDTLFKLVDFSRLVSITNIVLLHLKVYWVYSSGAEHWTIWYLTLNKNHHTQLLFELPVNCSKSDGLLFLTLVRKISIDQNLNIMNVNLNFQ